MDDYPDFLRAIKTLEIYEFIQKDLYEQASKFQTNLSYENNKNVEEIESNSF